MFFPILQSRYGLWCARHGQIALVIEAEAMTEDAGYRAVADRLEEFDSVLCANDILAAGVLRAGWADATSAAAPFGVVGMGNSYQARHARPPLTSIDAHATDKARLATELLLSMIEGREPKKRQVIVPHELVVRESTPPRGPF